jgi:HD superfamily phosphohydrolase
MNRAEHTKIIHDPLYGDITLSETAVKLIDTPVFARLRDIKQTSTAYKIFPSAVHSRFAHLIGVYGLTHRTIDSLITRGKLDVHDGSCWTAVEMVLRITDGETPSVTREEIEWICLGALLHDLGHGPASHTFDQLIEEFIAEQLIPANSPWRTHEERSQLIFRSLVHTTPDRFGLSAFAVDYICNVINPPPHLEHDFRFQFVNNEIGGVDTDKLDYLERDRYVFGLVDRRIDVARIIDNSSICVDGKAKHQRHMRGAEMGEGTYWTFGERTRDDIFTLFMTRYKLYRDIYNHPKIVKFELAYMAVLRSNTDDIVRAFLEQDIAAFTEMTDQSMLWRADSRARREFDDRSTYTLLERGWNEESDPADPADPAVHFDRLVEFDRIIEITDTVGFFGKNGFNPFDHIRFHDRKTNRIVNLRPHEISPFLQFGWNSEEIRYVFGYTKLW